VNKINRDKIILAYEKGYVSQVDGSVISPSGKSLIGSKGSNGYIFFAMRHKGRFVACTFHHLAAFAKFGESLFNDGIVVRHLNSIKTDNSHSNIMIGNHSDNMMDMSNEVRMKKAVHATSFIRKYDKAEVRLYYKNHGWKNTMSNFNISSKGTLSYILNK
jgi:hypothetical protein